MPKVSTVVGPWVTVGAMARAIDLLWHNGIVVTKGLGKVQAKALSRGVVANARAIDLLCHKKDRVLVLGKMLGLDVCTQDLYQTEKTCFPGLTWIGQAHPVFGKLLGQGSNWACWSWKKVLVIPVIQLPMKLKPKRVSWLWSSWHPERRSDGYHCSR